MGLRYRTTGSGRNDRPGRRVRFAGWQAILVAAVIGSGLAAGVPADAQGTGDWPSYLFDSGHSSYNADATAITTSNLADLTPIWQWFQPSSTHNRVFYASPTVVNGVVYIGSESGYFYAISESSQTVLWSRFLGITPVSAECGGSLGITGTAAVANDPTTGLTVYVNAADGHLYALDAATGATLWQATVDTPSTTIDDFYAWGSPLVANGHVYVGISSNCDNPLVPAGVVAFDQDTGAPQGTWNSLSGGALGASVWSTPAASTLNDGSIFATTGNSSGTLQPLYSESIVRLSGTDLSLLDSWQIPANQRVGDSDFGASPTVFTATINGTQTPMVGACNKNGIYYVFRQNDLHDGPVWQWRLAAGYGAQPNPGGQCDAAAVWDGTNLIEAGGNAAVINGVTYQGSVQSLDPATGNPIWQTGLPGEVIGSPTEDGSGVVAAQVFQSNTGNLGVYLLDAATGAILDFINTNPSPVFSQPVFANNDLLVAGGPAIGLMDYEIATPGAPLTNITPNAIGQGGTKTLTITGTGFSGTPAVFVSGTNVTPGAVTVLSSTSLQVTVHAASTATVGPRDVTVVEPGPVSYSCTGCLTVDQAPVVSSSNPSSVPVGEKAKLTITGSNFVAGAKVTSSTGISFGNTSVANASQLTTTVTVKPSVALGTYKIWVTNPDGGISGCACLAVVADPAPTLTSVTPSPLGQNQTATIAVTGTDLTTNSAFTFSAAGITVKSVKYTSPTSMSLTIAISSTATVGPGDVTVTTAGGSATCSGCLTIDQRPLITSIKPGTILNGTTQVISVTGSNFVAGLTVTTNIPGATVGALSQFSSTFFKVPVTVPAGTPAGSYVFKVTNPDGGTSSLTIKTD
jgi:outer membrane protein assembly factor BamB